MWVDRYEGLNVVFLGVTDREAEILAHALEGEVEAVLEPDVAGTPDRYLFDLVVNMQALMETVATNLQLRSTLYDALCKSPPPMPEPEPAPLSRWQRLVSRILRPLEPLAVKTPLGTALYVWALGPEARRCFWHEAVALLTEKAGAGGV